MARRPFFSALMSHDGRRWSSVKREKDVAQVVCRRTTPACPCVEGHFAVSSWLGFSMSKHGPSCCLSLNGRDGKEDGIRKDSTHTRYTSSGAGGMRSRWYSRTTSLFFFPFLHSPIGHFAIPARGMRTMATSEGTLLHSEGNIASTMRSSSSNSNSSSSSSSGSSLPGASSPTMDSISGPSSVSLSALHREQLRVALAACCEAERRKAERRRKRMGEWRGGEEGGGVAAGNEREISDRTFPPSPPSTSIPTSAMSNHEHPCGRNSSSTTARVPSPTLTSSSSSTPMVSYPSSASANSPNERGAGPPASLPRHEFRRFSGRPGKPLGSASSLPISPLSCTASSSSLPLSGTTPAWANNKQAKFWTMYVYTHMDGKEDDNGSPGSPLSPFASSSSSEKIQKVGEAKRERATPMSYSVQAEEMGDKGGQEDAKEAKEKKEEDDDENKALTREEMPFHGSPAPPLSSTLLAKETTEALPSSPPSPPPSVRLHSRKSRNRRERRRGSGNSSVLYHNKYKHEVAKTLSAVMDEDPVVGQQVLENLSADIRRLLLVMGTASEFYGEDYRQIADQVLQADRDRDRTISSTEFKEWMERLLHSRKETVVGGRKAASPPTAATESVESSPPGRTSTPPPGGARRVPVATSIPSTSGTESASTKNVCGVRAVDTTTENKEESRHTSSAFFTPPPVVGSAAVDSPLFPPTSSPSTSVPLAEVLTKASSLASPPPTPPSPSKSRAFPRSIYFRLLLTAGLPFLAFGLLDNSIFILAGDAIDRRLAMLFGFSSLAAAGFGGVVSGVAGIQVHGLAERWVGKVAPEPPLTTAQRQSDEYDKTYRNGSTIGMVVGLFIGMTPLLLINIRSGGGGGEDGQDGNPLEVPVVEET